MSYHLCHRRFYYPACIIIDIIFGMQSCGRFTEFLLTVHNCGIFGFIAKLQKISNFSMKSQNSDYIAEMANIYI